MIAAARAPGSPSPPTSSRTPAGRSPAPRRTSATCAARGHGFLIWASTALPDSEWAELNARLDGVRIFANTNLAGRAAAGRFDGIYTYDVLLFGGELFPRLCRRPAGSASCALRRSAPATTRGARPPTSGRAGGTARPTTRCGAARPGERRPRDDHELQRVARGDADRAGTRGALRGYQGYDGAWGLAEARPRPRTSIARSSGSPLSRLTTTSAPQLETSASKTSPGVDAAQRVVLEVDLDLRPRLEPSERPPSSAPKQSSRSVEKTPRVPVWRRAMPSSSRSSSSGSIRTFESEPMQSANPAVLDPRRRQEAVGEVGLGRRAGADRRAAAPPAGRARRRRHASRGRRSTCGPRQPVRSSSSIGLQPCSARHSSISRGCSSAWTCSGRPSAAAYASDLLEPVARAGADGVGGEPDADAVGAQRLDLAQVRRRPSPGASAARPPRA